MGALVANGKLAGKIARPLKVLVPLIQGELSAGHSAGMEHYRKAGEMLLEAKDQVAHGSWGRWLSKNFELSQSTARVYMRLARHFDRPSVEVNALPTSINQAIGGTDRVREQRVASRPLFSAMRDVDRDTFAQERQARENEVRLHRELAQELIELGYRALAMRLHPDRGGSKEAMVRLTAVRDELKSIAETRRFV